MTAESGNDILISRSASSSDEGPDEAQISGWIHAILSRLDIRNAEVSVRIVSMEEMTRLNEEFRGRPSPTNVLSFPSGLTIEGGPNILGDIAICSDVVRAEALEYHKSISARFAHMTVHGILHLLGHDHEAAEERRAMEALETDLLKMLEVSDPYEMEQEA